MRQQYDGNERDKKNLFVIFYLMQLFTVLTDIFIFLYTNFYV